MVISIDHSKFINNTEWILTARRPNCKCDATCSAILPCMHTVHILVVTPAQARLDSDFMTACCISSCGKF